MRVLHLSFREFLIDREKNEANPFWIDEAPVHENLAKNCLQHMDSNLRTNICQLRAPGTRRSAIDQQVIDNCLPTETQYACLYFVYHIEQAKDIRETDQVIKFFRRHLLHWLEALSLMGRLPESIGMIKTLQTFFEVRCF